MAKEQVSEENPQNEKFELADFLVMLATDEAREIVGGLVTAALAEVLPPIIDAQLGEKLPTLIEEIVPSVRAEREQAAAIAQAQQDASAARKAAADQQKAQAKAEARQAERRAAQVKEAREAFAARFGIEGDAVALDAEAERFALMLDDGDGFCIDHVTEMTGEKLVHLDDGVVRLGQAVDLPADMPAFVVQGVSIHDGKGGAVRCVIPTPLHVGGGRSAHLAADSLVLRPARQPVA